MANSVKKNLAPADMKDIGLLLEPYCSLLHEQLRPVSKMLEKMISSMQKEIQTLMESAEAKAKEAKIIYVKDDESRPDFAKVDVSKRSAKAGGLDQRHAIEHLKARLAHWSPEISATGVSLKSEMDKLNLLNDNLQNWLIGMVGILSMEDVISQRLTHIEKALTRLKNFIQYLESHEGEGEQELTNEINKMKAEVFKNFTMEPEKAIYKKHFGDNVKKSA